MACGLPCEGLMVEDSSGDAVAEFDVVLGVDHVDAPDLLDALRGVEMGVGQALEDDETLVLVDEVVCLVEGQHEFLADEFVEF